MQRRITFSETAGDRDRDRERMGKPSALETVMAAKLNQRFQSQRQQYEASFRPASATQALGTPGRGHSAQESLGRSLPIPAASTGRPWSRASLPLTGLGSTGQITLSPHALQMQTMTGASIQDLVQNPTRFNDEVRRRALDHIQGVEGEFKEKAQMEFSARVEIEKAELTKRLWPSDLDIQKSKAGKLIEKKVETLARQHVRRRMQLETEYLKLTQLGLRQVIEEEATHLRREIVRVHSDAVAAAEEAERLAMEQAALANSIARRSIIGSRVSIHGVNHDKLGVGLEVDKKPDPEDPDYVIEKVDWLEAQAGRELEWLDHTGTSFMSDDMKKLDARFMDVLLRSGAAIATGEHIAAEDDDLFYQGKNRIKKTKTIKGSRGKGMASRELVNVMLAAVKNAVDNETEDENAAASELGRRLKDAELNDGEEEVAQASWMQRGRKGREEVQEKIRRQQEEAEAENQDDGSYAVLGMRREPTTLQDKLGNLLQRAKGQETKNTDISSRLSRWTVDAVHRVSAREGFTIQQPAKPKATSMRTASEFFMMACKELKATPSAKLAVQLDNPVIDMTSTLLDLRNSMAFAEVLSRGLCLNLRSLRLTDASLTDEAVAALIRASKILPIRELVLRGNKVGMETAAELALALNPSSREIRRVVLMMRAPAVELVPSTLLRASADGQTTGFGATSTSFAPTPRPGTALSLSDRQTIKTRVMSAQTYRPVSREMERYSTLVMGNIEATAHHNAWTRRNPHQTKGPSFGAPPPPPRTSATAPPKKGEKPPPTPATALYHVERVDDVDVDEDRLDVSTRWHRTLRDLDLSNNPGLGDRGGALVLRALSRAVDGSTAKAAPRLITGTTMEHSLLRAPVVGEEETAPRLEVLLVEACGLTDVLHAELESVLTTNRALITLNLAWNKLRGASASAIARSMLAGCRVQDLDVGNNGLGDAGVAEILNALHRGMEPDTEILNHKGHLYVSRLSFRSTKAGSKSALALAALMPQLGKWGALNGLKHTGDQFRLSIDFSDCDVGGIAGQCLLRAIGSNDVDFRVGTEQYERLANVPGTVPSTELSLALLARDQYRRRERQEEPLPGSTVSMSIRAETFSSAHLEAQREAPALPGADKKKKKGGKKGAKKGGKKKEPEGDKKPGAKGKAAPPIEPPKPVFGQVGHFMALNLANYEDRQLVPLLLEHDNESNGMAFFNICWNNKTYREKGVDVVQGRFKCFREFVTSVGWLDPEKGLPTKGLLELDVLLVPYNFVSWKTRDTEMLTRMQQENQ